MGIYPILYVCRICHKSITVLSCQNRKSPCLCTWDLMEEVLLFHPLRISWVLVLSAPGLTNQPAACEACGFQ